jgi:hypothetical protein
VSLVFTVNCDTALKYCYRQDDDHDLEVSQFYEINADHHPIGGLSQVCPDRGVLYVTDSFRLTLDDMVYSFR